MRAACIVLAWSVAGCISSSPSGPEEAAAVEAPECATLPRPPVDFVPDGPGENPANASMYAAGTIVDFNVELTAKAWDQLQSYKAAKLKNHVPCAFEYDGERFENAALRLKGNESRWRDDKKNQYVVRFDYYDGDGRFRGLRRVNLDAEHTALIHNNAGMSVMRRAGIPAPRTNHARLFFKVVDSAGVDSDDGAYPNGYYGLYENIEVVDAAFVAQHFVATTGNLYKHGEELKNNGDDDEFCDLNQLGQVEARLRAGNETHAPILETLETLIDVDWFLRYMAAESALALGDNFWVGSNNYYLYNDPNRGFVWLPWDVDDTLSPFSPPEADTVEFGGVAPLGVSPSIIWLAAAAKPDWRATFDHELRRVRDQALRPLVDDLATLCALIRDADEADPNRFHTMEEFDWDCVAMEQRLLARIAFLDAELGP